MAAELTALRVCSFRGLQNLPVIAAQRRGLLAAAGLDVTLTLTNSSAQQLADLAAGNSDLVHTAPDNIINYDTNPAAFGLDPAHAPRAVMLMGGSNGPLTVYARRGVAGLDGLRGQLVGVDNPTSGFALALRDLLARAGLELERDYRFSVAGGTGQRASRLIAGEIAATILYPPFDFLAGEAGCLPLARSVTTYPAYASQALAATTAFLNSQGATVTRYIGALLSALRWIHEPAARQEVEALLAAEPALGLETASPARAYEAFTDPQRGYGARAALDDAGLAQVIALRSRYSLPGLSLGAPADYLNLRYYEAAVARLDTLPH